MKITAGPWTRERVVHYLTETAVPVRLACCGDDGWPLVLSLWYLYDDDAIWCATQANATVARHLARDGRCAFEIAPNEPPYCGVRGRGRVVVDAQRGAEVLDRLIARYLGPQESPLARWLRRRADQEVALRVGALSVSSWDFTQRMSAR
jgi:nitroimidazol reductase NimA-like FMN-containing flavoprotein (pyridoxamine 5'-phosphate oxidase superfamily)